MERQKKRKEVKNNASRSAKKERKIQRSEDPQEISAI